MSVTKEEHDLLKQQFGILKQEFQNFIQSTGQVINQLIHEGQNTSYRTDVLFKLLVDSEIVDAEEITKTAEEVKKVVEKARAEALAKVKLAQAQKSPLIIPR